MASPMFYGYKLASKPYGTLYVAAPVREGPSHLVAEAAAE